MLFIIMILYVGGLCVALLLIIRVEVVLEDRGSSCLVLPLTISHKYCYETGNPTLRSVDYFINHKRSVKSIMLNSLTKDSLSR